MTQVFEYISWIYWIYITKLKSFSDVVFSLNQTCEFDTYKKLSSLKLFHICFALYLYQILDKGFRVMTKLKISKMGRDSDKYRAKISFFRPSSEKYIWKSKYIWPKHFWGKIFDHYCQTFVYGKKTGK